MMTVDVFRVSPAAMKGGSCSNEGHAVCASGQTYALHLDRVALPQQAACGTGFKSISFILGLKELRLCRLLCGQPTLMVAATVVSTLRDIK